MNNLDWQQFHFIRVEFLWLILPATILAWLSRHQQQTQNAWRRYIDATLLTPLLKGNFNRPSNILPLLLGAFWCVTALALAGPTWKKLPQPVQKLDNALVILLDLSPSMLAQDVKPARLISARHKIIDLLKQRKEGSTALIAYAGDAHVVAPLTNDHQTIINLVNILEPAMMPLSGSNVEHALSSAFELFQHAGYQHGDILLLTDGITDQALTNSLSLIKASPFTLSIIGVGTDDGGPIPAARGGFLKDDQGNILMPRLEASSLQQLAKQGHGYYSPLQLNDTDIAPLVNGLQRQDQQKISSLDREFDQWQDMGVFLCLPLLAFVLIAFRRGAILSILLILTLTPIQKNYADAPIEQNQNTSHWHLPTWDELWLNNNQRAMKAMEAKQYDQAAKQFTDKNWKASAQYENKDYKSALEQFNQDSSATGAYNQGNALAKSGDIDKAIETYNKALQQKPDFEDARFNKELLEKIKQQQQNQDKNNQSSSDQNKEQDQDQQKNNGQDKSPDQNKSDQGNDGQNSEDEKEGNSKTEPGNKAKPDKNKKQPSEENSGPQNKDQQAKPPEEAADGKNSEQQSTTTQTATEQAPTEDQQALENWLRKVPDDPSILLRNKFQYYYDQKLQQQRAGKLPSHLNDEQRY